MMQMYNLIEPTDMYSKRFGICWQYYRDKPNSNIRNSESY